MFVEYFIKRFKAFFSTILVPYLKVEDFIYRFEFTKSDGVIHAHANLWLEDFVQKDDLIKIIL